MERSWGYKSVNQTGEERRGEGTWRAAKERKKHRGEERRGEGQLPFFMFRGPDFLLFLRFLITQGQRLWLLLVFGVLLVAIEIGEMRGRNCCFIF
ncbi:hypothetical protein OIU77_009088 [Salix suchowensis]|uniref:Uncharacterized protein n=1 Tax=Salix suchowensis TaxID=1278906 RepID=A0ABQ9AD53_9ROSI|nr:hypothetical protein OIU77_009088 [Salix suchowensis]